ncbi:MAG: hypothetical protein LM590_15480 [Thermofilum sp.]|nr:hypothetical protein [Thermofilum sp.]
MVDIRNEVEKILEEINERRGKITLSEIRRLFESIGFEEVTPESMASTLGASPEEAREYISFLMSSRESIAGNLVFSYVSPFLFLHHRESGLFVTVEYDYVLSRGGVYTCTFYTTDALKRDFELFKELLEKERAR